MTWMLIVGTAWLPTAALAALVLGRAITLADTLAAEAESTAPNFVVDPAFTVA